MNRLVVIALACVTLSSCGTFKKVFKLKESSKVEVIQSKRTDSTGLKVDKSITVITERIDTTVTVPGKTVKQDTYLNMDSLVNGMTAVKNDLIDVRLHLNPITGILSTVATIKPRPVVVGMDRQTTKQNDITEQSRKQEAALNKTKTENKRTEVVREPIKFPNWLIVVVILLVAGAAYMFWRKR